jgi:cobalt transporter subunit CbtA
MINLTVVKNIITTAALSGLLAGLLLTAIQQIDVIPPLLEAEGYEQAAEAAPLDTLTDTNHAHTEEQEEWQPEDGIERTLFTGLTNICLAFGFAMLLGVAMHLYGKSSNWSSGLLWGLTGYLVFVVAPALGLPPELPGTEAAALQDRQLWWLMTVLTTTVGLSFLVLVSNWFLKILGAVLLVFPYLFGAPQPQVHSSLAPEDLIHSFIYATVIANAVFWLCLGGLQGHFSKKLI